MSRSSSGQWNPPKELVALRERLAEVFDAGGGAGADDGQVRDAALSWSPGIDVAANEKTTVVTVEVTGVEPGDLEVTVDGASLIIRGERRRSTEGVTYHRIERSMGRFERLVELGGVVDPNDSDASTANGILTIVLHHVVDAPPGPHVIAVVPKKTG